MSFHYFFDFYLFVLNFLFFFILLNGTFKYFRSFINLLYIQGLLL
jgi:hypothetical protein